MLGIYINNRNKKERTTPSPVTSSTQQQPVSKGIRPDKPAVKNAATGDDLAVVQVNPDGQTRAVPIRCGATDLERYYKNLEDQDIDRLLRCDHDPSMWSAALKRETTNGNELKLRKLRALIGRQTIETIRAGSYFPSRGRKQRKEISKEKVKESAEKSSYWFQYEIQREFNKLNPKPGEQSPQAVVEKQDCLEAAFSVLQEWTRNPVVLNMANTDRVGGGFLTGAAAQEEYLCRVSSLFMALDNNFNPFGGSKHAEWLDKSRTWTYPLDKPPSSGMVYTKDVFVFRESEADGYGYLEKPFAISFITAAMPRLRFQKTETYDDPKMEDIVRRKIRALLQLALINGHDSIIVGAWGCGAFQHPPAAQALLWEQVLAEPEFKGMFPTRKGNAGVVFAIFDDHNTRKAHNPNGNYAPFKAVFP